MDKRYFLIIIIFILGCLCMFVVADSSDIIGSASVSFNGYSFSIPEGFTLMNTYDTSVLINHPKTGLFVAIYTLDKNYNYGSVLNGLKNDSNNTILSEGIIDINNVHVSSLFYYGPSSKGDYNNRSIFFFNLFDSTFEVQMSNFNYENRNEIINTLTLIVESLREDYKMK